jgi:hypothetical protein
MSWRTLCCVVVLMLVFFGRAGSPVDWFVMLKHSGATTYLYADAKNPTLAVSSNNLDSQTDGAVAQTINAVMKDSYAMYNDEVPNGGS